MCTWLEDSRMSNAEKPLYCPCILAAPSVASPTHCLMPMSIFSRVCVTSSTKYCPVDDSQSMTAMSLSWTTSYRRTTGQWSLDVKSCVVSTCIENSNCLLDQHSDDFNYFICCCFGHHRYQGPSSFTSHPLLANMLLWADIIFA